MKNWRKLAYAIIFSVVTMAVLVYFEYLVYPGIHLWLNLINCLFSFLFGTFGYFLGSVIDEETELRKN